MGRTYTLRILGIVGAVLVWPGMQAPVRADFGTAGWEIFRRVQSAQFTGLSLVAPENADMSVAFYNPAALGTFRAREISFTSEQGVSQDRLYSLVYGEPLRGGMIAAGFAYADAGTAELNWLQDGALMTENVAPQKDMLGMVAFQQQPSETISWGVSLKAASSELAQRNRAYAYAGDVGVFLLPSRNLSLSFAAQNLGTTTKFVDAADPLPSGFYAGAGYAVNGRSLTLLGTLGATYLLNDEKTVPEAGVEIGYGAVSFNAGYRSYSGEANTHLGLRLALRELLIGYAFVPARTLSAAHRLSVGYRFKTASK